MAEQIINQDGKKYRFIPGKNGSLTTVDEPKPEPFDFNHPHVAKVVPVLRDMRKRGYVSVGSVRG